MVRQKSLENGSRSKRFSKSIDNFTVASDHAMNTRQLTHSRSASTGSLVPVAEPDVGRLEEELVTQAIRSGWVSSLGPFVEEFESSFASWCNMRHGISTSSGTTALHLCLVAAGVGPGDEVIVPSLTFVATASAVKHAGATPVLVDCDSEIGTLSAAAVAAAITTRTRAIIVVHLFGHPADMAPITELGRRHNIFVVEDAAEGHGATYRGCIVGSLADASCFSFYGNKIITTGEGGMVLTNDPAFARRLRFLRDHAMDPARRYWHPEVGYNYRLTNPQAALGVAQLQRFDEIRAARQHVLEVYRALVLGAGLDVAINPRREWAVPTPWLVCAVLPPDADPRRRDHICVDLRTRGIDTRPYFIPMHRLPPYLSCRTVAAGGSGRLHCTESLAARGFNLPSSGKLSFDIVERVVGALADALRDVP
jgi:perosamine synthetase